MCENFCSSLREHATNTNIIDFGKKKMSPLTKEVSILHQDATDCYIYGKTILKKLSKSKNYRKLEITAVMQANIEAQHIVFIM